MRQPSRARKRARRGMIMRTTSLAVAPEVFPAEQYTPAIERIVVVLIKPTHYDNNGFPYRYWRGVLPSNSLAAMYALTNEALAHIVPGEIATEVYMLEDGIHRQANELKELMQRFPQEGTKLIVCMVAVQTAQFPRACDLIRRWQGVGAVC